MVDRRNFALSRFNFPPMKFANRITLGFDRFRGDANGNKGHFNCCSVAPPDVLVPDGAQAQRAEVYCATLLFSGGIKILAVIGKSTKRGHKKGLFVTQMSAHDP